MRQVGTTAGYVVIPPLAIFTLFAIVSLLIQFGDLVAGLKAASAAGPPKSPHRSAARLAAFNRSLTHLPLSPRSPRMIASHKRAEKNLAKFKAAAGLVMLSSRTKSRMDEKAQ